MLEEFLEEDQDEVRVFCDKYGFDYKEYQQELLNAHIRFWGKAVHHLRKCGYNVIKPENAYANACFSTICEHLDWLKKQQAT